MKIERPYLCKWDPSRYQRSLLLMGASEADVQAASVEALAVSRIHAEVVDSGSNKLRLRLMKVLHSLGINEDLVKQIMGRLRDTAPSADPGRSDLSGSLAPNGRAFYIEMKAPAQLDAASRVIKSAGKPRPDQLAYLDRKHAEGAIVGVAWSVDDVFAILGTENIVAHQQALRGTPEYF